MTRANAMLAALLTAAAALVAAEAIHARFTHLPQIANPCAARPSQAGGGLDGVVQQVVMGGLDRAACTLGTSREALVLAIGGSSAAGGPRWSRGTIETAVRAGLLGSLAEAERRAAVPAFARRLLEKVVRVVPIDRLVRGGVDLADLLG